MRPHPILRGYLAALLCGLIACLPASAGVLTYPEGNTIVFNPSTTIAGINVGAQSADPSAPLNGDIWYKTGTGFRVRSEGATITLGAGGSGGDALTTNPLSQFAATTSAQLGSTLSDETGSGLAVFATSPTLSTSLLTGSTTFALLNSTATTVNAFGAATTLNLGASAATVLNLGGAASSAELRFLEPSGSGTNYTGFKAQAQAANITYTLPAADGTDGQVMKTNGSGVLSWITAGGSGDFLANGSVAMTGAITFTGTTHPGIRLNNLTSTQRDAMTPLTGYTIWNTTTGRMENYNGSAWAAVDSSGSGDVTAASTFGTDNRLIRSDGTGKGVQASGITLDDSDNLTGVSAITASGTLTAAALSVKADVLESSLFAADAGASDTYVATLSPAITSYVTGAHYRFKANTANTGAATLNLNALGAKTIVKAAGGITTALADNDIRAGQWVDVVYDGTNLQMQSTLGNAASGSGDFVGPGSATDNAIARFDGTTGKLGQNSTITIDDTGAVTVPEMTAPATPAAGKVSFYAKSDGLLYSKDDAGTETVVTGGGGSGSTPTTTRGDLIRRGASADERLPLDTAFGSTPISNGTDPVWNLANNMFVIHDELISRTYASTFSQFGFLVSGSGSGGLAIQGRPGVVQVTTGTGVSDASRIECGSSNPFSFGGGRTVLTFSARTPTSASTVGDEYDVLWGFGSSIDMINGIYFEYNRNESATNWRCGVSSSSTRTESEGNGTPVAVAANTWAKFTIDINAAATEVKFYIDDVLVHTESGANIPDSTSFPCGIWFQLSKSAGAVAQSIAVDYVRLAFQTTSAR